MSTHPEERKLATMVKFTNMVVLKLLPYWGPARGDPPFEKIVASFAPK